MGQSLMHISGNSGELIADEFIAGNESIMKAIAYFDIFRYPLTSDEIRQYLDREVDDCQLSSWLKQLLEQKKIFLHRGFYSLQNNPLLAHQRMQGNHLAEKLLAKALRIGRFLYQFPFVRAVGISGSLSKNFADAKADIDFFIITKANRLWIARTLMHLYKKFTFLTGRQHYYCMNYYVDEKSLLLEEKNIFTAIEIKTLIPASGEKAMQFFFETNKWAGEYLPACNFRRQDKMDPPVSLFKKFWEWILSGSAGNRLENYLFRLTQNRWKRKAEKGMRNEKGQTMDLITGKHFARSNPGAFQEKVLALYEQKLSGLNQPAYQNTFIVSSAK